MNKYLSNTISKIIIMSFMVMLTTYIYCVLRIIKDTLAITILGAESINILKLYGVLPVSIVLILLYTKLVNILPRTTVYHLFNIWFLLFFSLFSIILFPHLEDLHLNFSSLITQYPIFKYQVLMLENWTISLFFIFAELWGIIMIALMFWQLANQIHTISEAKKIYPLFGVLAQIGMFASGVFTIHLSSSSANWEKVLMQINTTILICGITLSALLYILTHCILTKTVLNGKIKQKRVLSLVSSLKEICSSKYLGLLTLTLMSYYVSLSLIEGLWKKQIADFFINTSEVANFMGETQLYTAMLTLIAMPCGAIFLQKFSWKFMALVTPITVLISGSFFFIFSIFPSFLNIPLLNVIPNSLYIPVLLGATQYVLGHSIRYAFFEPVKEITYIPLADDLKAKGKSAVDVVGSNIGKSVGSIIQSTMLSLIIGSTLSSLAPSIFIIFLIIIAIWIFAVIFLNREFLLLSEK
jgi:AAA family ATP:ADP antiporter